jgi:hypothetical protein
MKIKLKGNFIILEVLTAKIDGGFKLIVIESLMVLIERL